MKITMKTLPLLLMVCVSLMACKKDVSVIDPGDNPGNPVNPGGNPANDIAETKPAIQKGITVNVNGNIGGYMETLPARYDSTTKKYPLLIFIHGIGELGNGASQLINVAWVGTSSVIKNGQFPPNFSVGGKNYSFIVISPQFKAWPSPQDVNAW